MIQGSPGNIDQRGIQTTFHEDLISQVEDIDQSLVEADSQCLLPYSETERPPNLSDESWEALIALHRSILYEPLGFFQTAREQPALLRLKSLYRRYDVPRPPWPYDLLGHLARYRMAIDAGDKQERATWTSAARQWYVKEACRAMKDIPETEPEVCYRLYMWRLTF